jgi:hypothetical protein
VLDAKKAGKVHVLIDVWERKAVGLLEEEEEEEEEEECGRWSFDHKAMTNLLPTKGGAGS